ncbi:MAG: RNA methyltransferase [Rhodospirillales bacterium]|nr:RNA methyltransferase [Rhodospirillales bacterium]
MAGTDKTRPSLTGGPAIILIEPQLGENIGATARAMLNFGLTDLRLVRPRDGWPNPAAAATAAGAVAVLEGAQVFSATEDAVAGLHHVLAVTARLRDSVKAVLTPREAGPLMRRWESVGEGVGMLFGPERAGLNNDDVALADTVLTIPANPAFSSLNLGQAVLLLAHAWYQSGSDMALAGPAAPTPPVEDFGPPATKDQLVSLFEHLEGELDKVGFFLPAERRKAMVRNLRNMIQRFRLTELDASALRGIIRALVGSKGQD